MNNHATLALLLSATVSQAAWQIPSPETVLHPAVADSQFADPRSYDDAEGFATRADLVIDGVAAESLERWRTGYYTRGDPGKYLPLHAMARLLRDPQDREARRYMNDDRSFAEHYHFAALNWARFLPIFGDDVLTEATRARVAEAAFAHSGYLRPAGTENNKVMWWSAANVLPNYLEGHRGLSSRSRGTTLASAKYRLRRYVRGLYAAGQGEWDSSTYLMFDLNAMLSIYDFAQDEESQLYAAAALDWFAAAYALKYRDGVFAGPKQRGFTSRPHGSVSDQTGYVWWGSNATLNARDTRSFRFALHAILSGWRPNAVLSRIARKEIYGLPIEQTGTKPNYWHGLGERPTPGRYRESLYIGRHVTMGSLWNGHGGQTTRFQVVAAGPSGAVCFTGGHPRRSDPAGRKTDIGYRDGIGRYDQIVQVGSTAMILTRIPDAEPVDYAFFSLPPDAEMIEARPNYIFRVGQAYVGVTAVGGLSQIGDSTLSEKEQAANARLAARGDRPRHRPVAVLRNSGPMVAYVVRVADAEDFEGPAHFVKRLKSNSVDTTRLAELGEISCTGLDLKHIRARFVPDPNGDAHGDQIADVWVNGRRHRTDGWPPYSGPIVRLQDSVLTVSDGIRSYEVDLRGEQPVYRDLAVTVVLDEAADDGEAP